MSRHFFPTALVGRSCLSRDGLSRILSEADFRIVASAERVADLPVAPLAQLQPLLLVLERSAEDANDLAGQIASFKRKHPAARVAVLADERQADGIVAAFLAGANVCLARSVTADAFVKALELVMLGETILPPELLDAWRAMGGEGQAPAAPARPANGGDPEPASPPNGHQSVGQLSLRQERILRCLVEGASNKVIARKMEIAEATVKVHVKAILRKIRVNNRTQAAIWALNNGPLREPSDKVLRLPSPRWAGRRDRVASE